MTYKIECSIYSKEINNIKVVKLDKNIAVGAVWDLFFMFAKTHHRMNASDRIKKSNTSIKNDRISAYFPEFMNKNGFFTYASFPRAPHECVHFSFITSRSLKSFDLSKCLFGHFYPATRITVSFEIFKSHIMPSFITCALDFSDTLTIRDYIVTAQWTFKKIISSWL